MIMFDVPEEALNIDERYKLLTACTRKNIKAEKGVILKQLGVPRRVCTEAHSSDC